MKASLKTGSNFQITVYPAGQIAAGQETSVEVRPVTGLAAGSYSDTLVITTAKSQSLRTQPVCHLPKRQFHHHL